MAETKTLSDYEKYIRTEELLALQKPVEACANGEEPFFQVMHQVAELWMKHMIYEVGRICRHMDADKATEAATLFGRVNGLLALMARQIELTETMAPADYNVIRITSLGRGSGQESPGFRKLLELPPDMWKSFSGLFKRRGIDMMDVERKPHDHTELFRLMQAMMDYDELFLKWRYTHLRLADRMIGLRVKSLKGVPATALKQGTDEHLFPELFELIPRLTDEYKPTY
jgi:tryptophan 2,3-dioxygenase